MWQHFYDWHCNFFRFVPFYDQISSTLQCPPGSSSGGVNVLDFGTASRLIGRFGRRSETTKQRKRSQLNEIFFLVLPGVGGNDVEHDDAPDNIGA